MDKYKKLLGIEEESAQHENSGLPWEGYYYSAYGIAVKHGFKGTEEEWLASLKGDRGFTGAKLISQARTGVDEEGNYIYTQTFDDGTTAEFVSPKGEEGNPGAPGPQGEPGEDGSDGKSAYESAQDGGYTGTEQQFNSDLAEVSNKYAKPSDGIPESDLAQSVRTKLAEKGVRWATYGTTTQQQVYEWAQAGYVILCVYQNKIYRCTYAPDPDGIYLGGVPGAEFYAVESRTNEEISLLNGTFVNRLRVFDYPSTSWSSDSVRVLTEHQSLAAYRTAAAQNVIDAGKVNTADYDPTAKTAAMTQAVGKDASGKLWTEPVSWGGTYWGSITGNLSSQWDLQMALNAKGTYSKPPSGIPESDLSSAVQTKLNATEIAWAEYGVTTASLICALVAEGKAVFVRYQGGIYTLRHITPGAYDDPASASFHCVSGIQTPGSEGIVCLLVEGSIWTKLNYLIEKSSNKVTSISFASTDTQYPSAKCVYDALAEKQDAVTGKGLSTNDYTDAAKAKVDAIPADPKYTDTVYDDTELSGRVTDIEDVISDQATAQNKLVSASEMGDAIEAVEAKQLYATSTQGSFATKAALLAATAFYGADGTAATPTRNDVAYVLADESHDGKSAKYVIANDPSATVAPVWGFVITFSSSAFTQTQMNAINSGIDSTKRAGYDSHVADGDIHVTAQEKAAWDGKLDADNPESTGIMYHKGYGNGSTSVVLKIHSNNGILTGHGDASSAFHIGGVPIATDTPLVLNGGMIFQTNGQNLDTNDATFSNVSKILHRGSRGCIETGCDYNDGTLTYEDHNFVAKNANIGAGMGSQGKAWAYQALVYNASTQKYDRVYGVKADGTVISKGEEMASKTYVDDLVGDVETALEALL